MPEEMSLPPSLRAEVRDDVAVLWLARPEKRNALNDATVLGIEAFFTSLPAGVQAVVLAAEGDHFCAGLDLAELTERSTVEGVQHSMMWHRAFERVEFGPVPVVSVLQGAVVGGGLELACATHIRVAETTAYFALPEGQRGIFVGGGASVRERDWTGRSSWPAGSRRTRRSPTSRCCTRCRGSPRPIRGRVSCWSR